MLVGLHVNWRGVLADYMGTYVATLDTNGIPWIELDCSRPRFWQDIEGVDLFVYRFAQYDHEKQIAQTLIPTLESALGVKCFPNALMTWLYDDKVNQQAFLSSKGLPMVKGWVFYDPDYAMSWLAGASFPLVFKLRCGAASENVRLVRNRREAKRIVDRMFSTGIKTKALAGWRGLVEREGRKLLRKRVGQWAMRVTGRERLDANWRVERNYVYFEEFLPGNLFDTRVTVIGNRAFAFRRMVRDNDFRASGSGRLDHDPRKIDLRCVEAAIASTRALGVPCMAYDCLFTREGEVRFSEVSYTFMDEAVHRCPGYWDGEMHFHEGHYWPAWCILSDALGRGDLRQP